LWCLAKSAHRHQGGEQNGDQKLSFHSLKFNPKRLAKLRAR
jgi:hypothetical protein